MNLNEISYLDNSNIKCDVGGLMVDNVHISLNSQHYNYEEFYTTQSLDLFQHYDTKYYPKTLSLKKFIEFEIMGAKTAIISLKNNQTYLEQTKISLKKLKKINALQDENLYNGLEIYFIKKGLNSKDSQSKANEFRITQKEYLNTKIQSLKETINLYTPNKIINTIKNICLQNLIHEFKKHNLSLKNKTDERIIAKHILTINSLSTTDEYISLKDLRQKIQRQNVTHQTRYILNFD